MTYRLKPIVLGASLFACLTSALSAQVPAAVPGGSKLEFEVASVKAAAPMTGGFMRIGMRVDAGRMDYANVSLKDCIRTAYGLSDYQISGPDWLSGARFDIVAKLPEGATKDQVPEMLQALLAERFKIAVHHESKVHDTYALAVAKNGPKLTASAPPEKPDAASGPSGASGGKSGDGSKTTTFAFGGGGGAGSAGGVAAGPRGGVRMNMGAGGTMQIPAKNQTLPAFAELLARFLGSPVVDLTEIQGTYDFNLELSMGDLTRGTGVALKMGGPAAGGDPSNPAGDIDTDNGSTIFKSVANYGLKLDRRRAPMDFLIIDHIEKVPTEN